MSKVLTNGVIIPDNGSRNWGGDLANNWNILDVNIGYMNDVKNRVTTLENNLSNYVDLSSEQIISGTKTFSSNIVGNLTGNADTATSANDPNAVHKTGNETISGVKTFSNDVRISKTLNGVNPGALSLPDHNSYLDIKGNLPASVSDDAWVTRCQITPERDGILILTFMDCAAAVVWSNSDLPSYGDRGTSISLEKRVMAFVLKGVTYGIFTGKYSQVASARIFYCQGNV